MALTGYEKPLTQYTKSELVQIAKTYTVYYQTSFGRGSVDDYQSLTNEKLIDLISKDRDYQKASKKYRIQILKSRIKGKTNSEDIMIEIISLFKDLEFIPEPGKYYTFIYNAKTPGMRYDQHPLIAALEVHRWGFKGLNFHWQDIEPSHCIRNYTWNEIAGQLYVVYNEEIDYMKSINYAKFLLNK